MAEIPRPASRRRRGPIVYQAAPPQRKSRSEAQAPDDVSGACDGLIQGPAGDLFPFLLLFFRLLDHADRLLAEAEDDLVAERENFSRRDILGDFEVAVAAELDDFRAEQFAVGQVALEPDAVAPDKA